MVVVDEVSVLVCVSLEEADEHERHSVPVVGCHCLAEGVRCAIEKSVLGAVGAALEIGDKRERLREVGIDGGCSALTGEDAMRIIKESGVTPIVSPVGKFDGAFRPFTVPARYVSPWWQG